METAYPIFMDRKSAALWLMQKLGISKFVIDDFEKDGSLYYSERQNASFNAVLYFLPDRPDILKEVRRLEKELDALVYHVVLSHTRFGDLWSMLYITSDLENWEVANMELDEGLSFVWCYNSTEPLFSEFGTIGVEGSMGGVVRTM